MFTDHHTNRTREEIVEALEKLQRHLAEDTECLALWQDCLEKPVRSVLQLDCLGKVPPNNAATPDEDGDLLMCGWQRELRRTQIPVRVQIMEGTPAKDAIAWLRKLLDWLERDAAGLYARGNTMRGERSVDLIF